MGGRLSARSRAKDDKERPLGITWQKEEEERPRETFTRGRGDARKVYVSLLQRLAARRLTSLGNNWKSPIRKTVLGDMGAGAVLELRVHIARKFDLFPEVSWKIVHGYRAKYAYYHHEIGPTLRRRNACWSAKRREKKKKVEHRRRREKRAGRHGSPRRVRYHPAETNFQNRKGPAQRPPKGKEDLWNLAGTWGEGTIASLAEVATWEGGSRCCRSGRKREVCDGGEPWDFKTQVDWRKKRGGRPEHQGRTSPPSWPPANPAARKANPRKKREEEPVTQPVGRGLPANGRKDAFLWHRPAGSGTEEGSKDAEATPEDRGSASFKMGGEGVDC